jgi:HK97 family phage portal protein
MAGDSYVINPAKRKFSIPFTIQKIAGGFLSFGGGGLQKIFTNSTGRKMASEIGGDDPLAIYAPSNSGNVNAKRAVEAYIGIPFAMIRAIQDEIANIEWKVYRINSKGENVELPEHELLDLLYGVNDYQTGVEFKHILAGHLELVGNFYGLMLGQSGQPVKNAKEKPTQLHILNPGSVKVIKDKSQFPWRLSRYDYTLEGSIYHFAPYQILHIKFPNPNDNFEGIGTLQAVAEWVDLDHYVVDHNRKFFLRGARKSGVIETEMTGEDQLETLSKSWNEKHSGTQNAWGTPVLPKGVHFVDDKMAIKDMDFKNLCDEAFQHLAMCFRVSHTILGTAESDTNRATAETADYVFAKRTIKPKMTLICSYINEFLTPRFGEDIYVGFDDPTPEDKNFRIQEMQATVGSQPVLSANEARERYIGEGPVKGGDSVMVGASMMPLGSPQPKDDNENPAPGKSAVKYHKSRYARNAEVRQSMAKSLGDAAAKIFAKIKNKKITEMSADELQVVIKKRDGRVDDNMEIVANAIRKLNKGQKKEVLENLKSKVKAVNFEDIFNFKKWLGATIDVMTPLMKEIGRTEGRLAGEMLDKPGIDVIANDTYANALKHAINLFSTSYQQTTLDALKQQLEEGTKVGEGIVDLTKRVQTIYDWSDTARAEKVARTEVFRVSNSANKEAWKQSGAKKLEWFTSKKDNVCELCQEMDGKIIDINDNFFDKGDTFSAGDETMTFGYDDVGAPPLHPACGCFCRPAEISLND